MAGPTPWQAKAARDTGVEPASPHAPATEGSTESVAAGPHDSAAASSSGSASADAGEPAVTSSVEGAAGGSHGLAVASSAESAAAGPPSSSAGSGGSRVARQVGEVRERMATARGVASPLRGHWGYLLAAAGAFITLILMTRPWLVASGANGSVESTAFGRIDVTTKYLTVWSKSPPKTPQVSGLWAFVTAAVIVLTICFAVLYFRMRTEFYARMVAGSSVAVAVLVLFTMLYLDSKGAELKALTSRKYDLGGQVGQFLSWVNGQGKFILPGAGQGQYVATSRFTPSAVACAVIAVASALAAIGQWLVGRGAEPRSLVARVSAMRERWDAAGRAVAAAKSAGRETSAGSAGAAGSAATDSGSAEAVSGSAGAASGSASAARAGNEAAVIASTPAAGSAGSAADSAEAASGSTESDAGPTGSTRSTDTDR
ncbi:hypothetical protein ACFXNW_19630 [Nocardia sp. NPDC059180]|uniref:hypothetical protein n=1 Tax=Nocardia sp. NPDC059180 TaxID=3346761 RepID=UPI00368F012D